MQWYSIFSRGGKKIGINIRELKTTIFRENKLSRILKNRIFRGIKLSRIAKIAKVSSALFSSFYVKIRFRKLTWLLIQYVFFLIFFLLLYLREMSQWHLTTHLRWQHCNLTHSGCGHAGAVGPHAWRLSQGLIRKLHFKFINISTW